MKVAAAFFLLAGYSLLAGCVRVHTGRGAAGLTVADPGDSDLALVRAAWSGDRAALGELLAASEGAKGGGCDRNGTSALGAASLAGHFDAATALLAAGAPPDGACEQDNPLFRVLEPLANEALEGDAPDPSGAVTAQASALPEPPGRTYGSENDRRDRFRIVAVLLENGADPNRPFGSTATRPIASAILSGDEAVTRLLIEHGADPGLQKHLGLLARISGQAELHERARAWRRAFLEREPPPDAEAGRVPGADARERSPSGCVTPVRNGG